MFFNGNTMSLMKEIVPEYVSNNSEFCKLDNKIEEQLTTTNKGEKKIFQS